MGEGIISNERTNERLSVFNCYVSPPFVSRPSERLCNPITHSNAPLLCVAGLTCYTCVNVSDNQVSTSPLNAPLRVSNAGIVPGPAAAISFSPEDRFPIDLPLFPNFSSAFPSQPPFLNPSLFYARVVVEELPISARVGDLPIRRRGPPNNGASRGRSSLPSTPIEVVLCTSNFSILLLEASLERWRELVFV